MGKIRNENGKVSIVLIITDIHAHARLSRPGFTQGCAGFQAYFSERTVLVVAEEKIRGGVIGHINIGPAIVVQIAENNTEPIIAGVVNAGLFGHIAEHAVAIVVQKHVRLAAQPTRSTQYIHSHVLTEGTLAGSWRLLWIKGNIARYV